ncbi:MAG: hypothetical protein V3U45_08400 [bacterium]
MAYLPGEDGRVKKRILVRKGFMEDHLDELSAIVRGENTRSLMAPVRGWRRSTPVSEAPSEPPPPQRGAPRKDVDREALAALMASSTPLRAVAKAFGISVNTLYARLADYGIPTRRGTVKTGSKHGGP